MSLPSNVYCVLCGTQVTAMPLRPASWYGLSEEEFEWKTRVHAIYPWDGSYRLLEFDEILHRNLGVLREAAHLLHKECLAVLERCVWWWGGCERLGRLGEANRSADGSGGGGVWLDAQLEGLGSGLQQEVGFRVPLDVLARIIFSQPQLPNHLAVQWPHHDYGGVLESYQSANLSADEPQKWPEVGANPLMQGWLGRLLGDPPLVRVPVRVLHEAGLAGTPDGIGDLVIGPATEGGDVFGKLSVEVLRIILLDSGLDLSSTLAARRASRFLARAVGVSGQFRWLTRLLKRCPWVWELWPSGRGWEESGLLKRIDSMARPYSAGSGDSESTEKKAVVVDWRRLRRVLTWERDYVKFRDERVFISEGCEKVEQNETWDVKNVKNRSRIWNCNSALAVALAQLGCRGGGVCAGMEYFETSVSLSDKTEPGKKADNRNEKLLDGDIGRDSDVEAYVRPWRKRRIEISLTPDKLIRPILRELQARIIGIRNGVPGFPMYMDMVAGHFSSDRGATEYRRLCLFPLEVAASLEEQTGWTYEVRSVTVYFTGLPSPLRGQVRDVVDALGKRYGPPDDMENGGEKAANDRDKEPSEDEHDDSDESDNAESNSNAPLQGEADDLVYRVDEGTTRCVSGLVFHPGNIRLGYVPTSPPPDLGNGGATISKEIFVLDDHQRFHGFEVGWTDIGVRWLKVLTDHGAGPIMGEKRWVFSWREEFHVSWGAIRQYAVMKEDGVTIRGALARFDGSKMMALGLLGDVEVDEVDGGAAYERQDRKEL